MHINHPKTALAALAFTGSLAAAALGLATPAASAHPAARTVSATINSPATAGQAGWQGRSTYTVPTGLSYLFIHYACPAGRVALSGAFSIVSLSQPDINNLHLIGNQPFEATTPQNGAWAWTFNWPGTTSPSGSQIVFNVYCK